MDYGGLTSYSRFREGPTPITHEAQTLLRWRRVFDGLCEVTYR